MTPEENRKRVYTWYQANKHTASYKEHRKAYRKRYNVLQKGYRLRDRRRCLAAYGTECKCCGESIEKFLSIDHIAGGGSKHRREIKRTGTAFYKWLIQNNFPPGYQTLCHNCNMAKSFYGVCPHKEQM